MLGVSLGSVQGWERSEVRGTAQLNTIERALTELGEEFVTASKRRGTLRAEPLERREERVALELHRAVAQKLIDDPNRVLDFVPGNVARLAERVRGDVGHSWLAEWSELAEVGSIGGLVDVMLGTDRRSIDMRQVSPFMGVLTEPERLAAIDRASRVTA
jgi:hypothetical protein